LCHISLLVWTVTYRMNLRRCWTPGRLHFCNCYGIQPATSFSFASLWSSARRCLWTHSGTLPTLTFWIHRHCHAINAVFQVASLWALTLLHWAGSFWHFEQLRCVACSWTAWTWRWRHCDPSEYSELLIQWHSITFQKTSIFSNTSVRTSNLTGYVDFLSCKTSNLALESTQPAI
jgi:hypothetical protein